MAKHLDNNTKHPKVLLCYDLTKGITDKEKEIFFLIKPIFFTIGTITLSELGILNTIIFNAEINIEDLTFKFLHFEG
jgi:hypothetical protein